MEIMNIVTNKIKNQRVNLLLQIVMILYHKKYFNSRFYQSPDEPPPSNPPPDHESPLLQELELS